MDLSFAGTMMVVFGSSGLFIVLSLALARRSARRRERLQLELDRLRNDFSMVQAGNIGLGKALLRLQRQMQQLSDPAGPVSPESREANGTERWTREPGTFSQSANDEPEFERAEEMIRAGAALDRVTRETGLTRSEVELMALLQHPGYEVAVGQ